MSTDQIRNKKVTLSGVTFFYGQRSILEDIDLDVGEGSYCGIVGPNGSGKTTLALLIAGILKPSSGTVNAARTGLVMANPVNQIVSLVVEEDVAFGPENLRWSRSRIRKCVDASLRATGADRFIDRMTDELSGGETSRVALAGQLAMDTDVLVFDEGTAMLDPPGRKSVLDTLAQLNGREKKTVIHISHRLEDLARADSLICISGGRIVARADNVFDLVNSAGGIERGGEIGFRSFLRDLSIKDDDLEKATARLARRLDSGC